MCCIFVYFSSLQFEMDSILFVNIADFILLLQISNSIFYLFRLLLFITWTRVAAVATAVANVLCVCVCA